MPEFYESETYFFPALKRFNKMLPASIPLVAVSLFPGLRSLPVPNVANIFQHIGNVPLSIFIGASASFMARNAYEVLQKPTESEQQLQTRIRRIGLTAGIAAGVVGNAIYETKYGIDLLNIKHTMPDSVDLMYGVVAAAVGAGAPTTELFAVTNENISIEEHPMAT